MTKPQRYRFLDLYRGLIVLLMLEGHVLRALLTLDAQRGPLFTLHELLHGLIGPGFLFGAGFSFAIGTQRRLEALTSVTPMFFRRLWRALFIFFLGYAIHIPYLSLAKTILHGTPQQFDVLFAFDILQCIGITLLGLRIILLFLKKETWFIHSLFMLLLLIVYATPLVWTKEIELLLPRFLVGAVSGHQGAFFPLFPSAAFLLAGVIVAWLFLRKAQEGTEHRFLQQLLIVGIILIGGGYLVDALPVNSYPAYNFWYTSPNYFWMRLGGLFLLLTSLWFFESYVTHRDRHDIWMPMWLILLGVESFVVYIAHLVILYGWVINGQCSMSFWWGWKLNIWESILAWVALTLLMAFLATGWQYLKKNHPVVMQGIYWYLNILFLYYFLTSMY
ncbi:MAG: heparan-alpha-glucosaminide N-acetyltransferase domain-containing protein [bacterium]